MKRASNLLVGVTALLLLSGNGQAWAARGGQLEVLVVDDKGQPIACRMHLKNAAKKAPKIPGTVVWNDHFVFSGSTTLKLNPGIYTFEVERGLEYLPRYGHFEIADFAEDSTKIELKRFVDLTEEGWWSGDFDVPRSVNDIELLMDAEDLHMVTLLPAKKTPSKTKAPKSKAATDDAAKENAVKFDSNRYYYPRSTMFERPGGSLLLLNLDKSLELPASKEEIPSSLKAIELAREAGITWADAPRATSWDLPMWIAHGQVQSVELAPSNLLRDGVAAQKTGKPRDENLLRGPRGVGQWTEMIYYHLLNCGLKLPPTAGSGSGVAANPVGYNRMYVHCGDEFSPELWWQNLRAGKVVVTNGPLLRPLVEGELPGHVFKADKGSEVELEVGLTLSIRSPEKVAYLEIVQDGHVGYEVRLDDWVKAHGKVPHVKFTESGWFLIRAVTNAEKTYRFASTAPYYVEIGYEPRISKASVKFFLDWATERAEQINKLKDTEARAEVVELHQAAIEYWKKLLKKANAP